VLVYTTLILTMLEGFQNPEVVTLTVCLLTLYRLEYRETTKRSDMRTIVALSLISLVYDVI